MENRGKTIAFYIGSLEKGGAERVIVNLAQYFYQEGYRIFVVTKLAEKDEYTLSEGICRIEADITSEEESRLRVLNLFLRIRKLRKIWKQINPNIIVSFIRKNNVMAIASSRLLNISVVVSIRSNPARELQGKIMKHLSFFLFRFSSGIVVQTSQAKDFFPHYLQKKIVILPNSLNPVFLNVKKEQQTKKEIVTVGRIDKNKNQRMLIEVFGELAYAYPEWSLCLYGDGAEEEDLKKFVKQNGWNSQILFKGQVTDIQEHIKDSAIFVLTSKQEGMPNALIEAMAMGLAVVSTDCPCGGPADLIIDGKNGILIPVDDRDALKEALYKVMNYEIIRNEMGQNATAIADTLHPNIVNKQWKDYLESL